MTFLFSQPEDKFLAVCALTVLGILLVPLFGITRYCIPWYDDYNFGNFVKNFLELDFTLSNVWQGIVYCVKTQWWAWQGTFSSIALMSLVPIVWNDNWYFLGLAFLILLFTVAIFIFVKVLVRDVLKGDRYSCIILQAGTAVLLLELIHCMREGFFWYNGGIHYIGMHSFMMLYIAAMVELCIKNRALTKILCVVLSLVGAVLCGGANFVTALQAIIIGLSLLLLGFVFKKKSALLMIPVLLLNGYCFYINVRAPGNAKRAVYFEGMGQNPVQAILNSFLEAGKHIWEFTGWMTILILILLLPTIWKLVKKCTYNFRFPGFVFLWSFCLYATGFTPSLYTMGNAGAERTLNAVKVTFQLLLIFNEVYFCGWICRKNKLKNIERLENTPMIYYLVVLGLVMAVFVITPAREGAYSSWGAFYFLRTGEAQNHYQEYRERIQLIQESGDDVWVSPYQYDPYILNMGDITRYYWDTPNMFMARWYRKNSIRLRDE